MDAWKTGDDNEEGEVIAKISESGEVVYLDAEAEDDEYAKEVISEKLKDLAWKMHFALEKIRGFCFAEKIRQKFAYAGKSGIIYTRDEEKAFPQYIRRIRRRNSFLC